jgi:hypothetical protein
MIVHKNQKHSFDLSHVEAGMARKIGMRAAVRSTVQREIPVEIDILEARLEQEIGLLKLRFAALETAVEQIKRHRDRRRSLARQAGKND